MILWQVELSEKRINVPVMYNYWKQVSVYFRALDSYVCVSEHTIPSAVNKPLFSSITCFFLLLLL